MPAPFALRDVLGALAVTTAAAAGLVALSPWPWSITIPASVVSGASVLILDVVLFGRPVRLGSAKARATMWCLGTLAGISALALAFGIGRSTQGAPDSYPFVVTADGNLTALIKAVPADEAQTDYVLRQGSTVFVDCYVDESHRRWYRLSDSRGWLNEDEVIPAPYTGLEDPPKCPT